MDGLRGNQLHGWAWDTRAEQPHLRIEVRADGVLLGSTDAAIFRADLAMAGKRNGHCAFAIALDPLPAPGTVLTVAAAGGGMGR